MSDIQDLQIARRRFDGILYDLDGTLVETAPDLCAALNHCLDRAGMPQVSLARVRDLIGDGARALLRRGLGKDRDDRQVDELFPVFLEYYGRHIADYSHAFAGVMAVLRAADEVGFAQAVCTNKPEGLSRALLSALGMARYLPVIVGGDSLTVRKPDPAHVAATAKILGQSLDRCVMIGDSANDIISAKAAGIPVIAVSFGYCKGAAGELGADRLIDHFCDLPAALADLAQASWNP